MGEKRRSTLKSLAKNKKRKGTHLTKKKTIIRDEKRPLNSKIDSDDVNEEERVPEEEESKKNENELPEDLEEDERNLAAADDDDDGENSKLKMESQRRPKKKKKKKSRLCPHTLKGSRIMDKSYFDRLHAKYPKLLPYMQKIAQSAPYEKMNPGPIPHYEASPTFMKEAMKQMKMKEESEKTTDVSVSKAQEIPKRRRPGSYPIYPTYIPSSSKEAPFVFTSRCCFSSRSRCNMWTWK